MRNNQLLHLSLVASLFVSHVGNGGAAKHHDQGRWANPSRTSLHTQGEIPFFKNTIVEMSQGKIKAELVSQEQVGISGGEVMRLLSKGSIDFGSGGLTQAVSDSPKFEGCDLPGLTDTLDEARAACEAYRPVISSTLEKSFGVKLLALAYNPPQAIWWRRANFRP